MLITSAGVAPDPTKQDVIDSVSISVIVGLILAVGLMSLSESALVTARRWRLRERAARGERGAAAALRLTEHFERFVSTVRVGATLAGTRCRGLRRDLGARVARAGDRRVRDSTAESRSAELLPASP